MRKELEQRLIILVKSVDSITRSLKPAYLSKHLTTQILRSSTSAALNYGEAQASESRNDFIHKISLVTKELKETKICLQLMENLVRAENHEEYNSCLRECDQLIAIFYKTIISARRNLQK
jgi:four helix bundle protein